MVRKRKAGVKPGGSFSCCPGLQVAQRDPPEPGQERLAERRVPFPELPSAFGARPESKKAAGSARAQNPVPTATNGLHHGSHNRSSVDARQGWGGLLELI